MNLEIATRDIADLRVTISQAIRNSQILHDSIRSLERIAVAHQERPDKLEGQDNE